MKLLYQILIFLTVFYGVILMVNSMNIFPVPLFTSGETGVGDDSPGGIITAVFIPNLGNFGLSESDGAVLGTAITGFIVTGAAISGFIMQSPILPAIMIVGYLFFNMMVNSYSFFSKLFTGVQGSPSSLMYMGICIGAALMVVGFITIVEMIAQGGSGGE